MSTTRAIQAIEKVSRFAEQSTRYVKPIKSANAHEAHRNVLATYKMYIKNLPEILHAYEGLNRSQYEFKVAIKRFVRLIQILYNFFIFEQPLLFVYTRFVTVGALFIGFL